MLQIQSRRKFYEEIPSIVQNLEDAIKYSYENFNNTDEKYIHILESDRQTYMNKAKENQEYLKHIKEILSKKQKFEDSDIRVDDLIKRALQQREATNQIMSRPKPVLPKAEEKHKEHIKDKSAETKSKMNKEKMRTEESKEELPMEID